MPDAPSYHFTTAIQLQARCEEHACSIADLMLLREANESNKSVDEILERMGAHYAKMRDSIKRGLEITGLSPSGLSGGDAGKLHRYSQGDNPLFGSEFSRTMAYGFAVLEHNAQFGRIVATPTAGSSGILPACLMSLEETRGITEQQAAKALFTAAGIGVIIGENATFSGARGGCQAEVGSASSMAAAAICEALGAPPEQAINAAAFALMNTLGLVCDPVGGYVEVPCVSRNGAFAIHSFQAAIMAMASVGCRIPLDDVVIAMRDIARRMPAALKETSKGGLAQTPAGLKYGKGSAFPAPKK